MVSPDARPDTEEPALLSVRSAVLSVLLGAHPEALPAAKLAKAAQHLDIPAANVRVALSRAVAAGELNRTDAGYTLGERLLKRQLRQQEAVKADPAPWAGDWETAVVVAGGRPNAQRVALRNLLSEHRLAELREGVWMRPANLARTASYAEHSDLMVLRSYYDDPAELVVRLWDLDAWSSAARRLLARFEGQQHPAQRLAAAAALVRHLSTDPLLPAQLLPEEWPAQSLRIAYTNYQRELHELAAGP